MNSDSIWGHVVRSLGPMLLIGLLALGGATTSADAPEQTEKAVVRLVFFWFETCPHCHEVMDNHLPILLAKCGDQLEIASISVSDAASYEIYLSAIDLFQVPPGWFSRDSQQIGWAD